MEVFYCKKIKEDIQMLIFDIIPAKMELYSRKVGYYVFEANN